MLILQQFLMSIVHLLTNKEDHLDILESIGVLGPGLTDGIPRLEVLHGAAHDD